MNRVERASEAPSERNTRTELERARFESLRERGTIHPLYREETRLRCARMSDVASDAGIDEAGEDRRFVVESCEHAFVHDRRDLDRNDVAAGGVASANDARHGPGVKLG